MLTVKINAYNKGLVFRNNRYVRMLNEGRHWLSPGDDVKVYDMLKAFQPSVDMAMLLKNNELADALNIVDVRDHEIALRFEEGHFKSVLPPGRYAFWREGKENTFTHVDLSKIEMTEIADRSLLSKQELQPYIRIYNVESYEKAVLFREGKQEAVLEPGVYYFWRNSITLTVYKIDTRQQQMEMNGQEMLTKDKANLRINFYLQYRVLDIFKAMANKEYEKQLYGIMQLALREQVGTYTLDELLDKRDIISPVVLQVVQEKAANLGVSVNYCGIRDIILPGDMKDIMNQVLLAEKKAQANIIMRREETASTRSLMNTAKLMEENEMLFRLKEMEYVEKIADKINSISVSGGDIAGQLKQLFIPASKHK
jgi:hypothetical protein